MTIRHRVMAYALAFVAAGSLSITSVGNSGAENIFSDVDVGLFSIGGRATYFDPKEGDDRWFGGAQVRVHPIRYLAVEGSVDYRRNDFGDTRVHSYPVQGSLMIYPLGLKRISPFILGGGGWYFTTVTGPGGFDDTQQRFGGHVGGGVQVFISNHISADASYRHIWLEKIESKNVSLDDKKFNDNGHMVTVGLNFHF
ncbi:MAG TPA: outer membrane beta-barrel protein [Nitrospira sp.]|nr:outer membrane beta-barrel protein [Nitrospira sp.]